MKSFIHWLEHSFSPRMSVVNSNPWIVSLKDAIMKVLPFIFLGSLFAMLAVLNDVIPWLPSFWEPYGWTMGLIGLFVAFLIPFNLMERLELRRQQTIAGLTGLVVFIICVNPQIISGGNLGLSQDLLGAGGMFVAIVTGLFVGLVMKIIGSFSFFKESSAVPDFVRAWFDAMLPIALCVVPTWLLVQVAGFDLAAAVQTALSPISGLLQNPFGFAFAMFLACFIYSMGISVWVLTPIYIPAMYQAMAENINGQAENLVTYSTVYATYLWIGGVGVTLPLVFMMLRARSKRLRALGRASVAPSILNINEPVVFGAIAWNPPMMIGMWLQGLIMPLVLWLFTKIIPFAPVPMRQFDLWYVPFPVSTWLSTGSVTAIILVVGMFVLAGIIWFPFFAAYDRQLVRSEAAEADAAAAKERDEAATDADGVPTAATRAGGIRRSSKRIPKAAPPETA